MIFRKDFLFVVALIVLLFPNIHSAQAMSAGTGLPAFQMETQYDYKSDPFLLQWTFAMENKDSVADPQAVLSREDALLEHWKSKQGAMWDALPDGQFVINASGYTAAADECGKNDGVTASGLKVEENRTLACPPAFPFGTKVSIEGVGELRCEDRGGAIKGNHFDIYVKTKSEAFAFGRRHLLAEVVK